MISAIEALRRLKDGNRRFLQEDTNRDLTVSTQRRRQLTAGQEPFAIILGCSDSRVPAEIIFDQGLGDLFVIRVAGNIVAPSQIGSVEFAADLFDTRLVVVLGHSMCGAVQATIEEMGRRREERSPNRQSIVDRIRPAVESVVSVPGVPEDLESRMKLAVRANIRMSVNQLRHGSAIIEQAIAKQGLLVVGAEYCLETGVVDFFEGGPETP